MAIIGLSDGAPTGAMERVRSFNHTAWSLDAAT
jgi:hypothetical protein